MCQIYDKTDYNVSCYSSILKHNLKRPLMSILQTDFIHKKTKLFLLKRLILQYE